ncbi:hypothetical protein L226DRAFT_155614 [Lentinus tigrinus ALCF2SS1-7]|uniref:uncharacterized protein n=1 Tax=Lentinus tigrinus ALCF2SS1-7 TaxID=1328758 RepID=UPI001165FB8A|nr:hypothetical protein L226DRAFT_155614 [Lentinus tigrinus ALCF2SS1-7]
MGRKASRWRRRECAKDRRQNAASDWRADLALVDTRRERLQNHKVCEQGSRGCRSSRLFVGLQAHFKERAPYAYSRCVMVTFGLLREWTSIGKMTQLKRRGTTDKANDRSAGATRKSLRRSYARTLALGIRAARR